MTQLITVDAKSRNIVADANGERTSLVFQFLRLAKVDLDPVD